MARAKKSKTPEDDLQNIPGAGPSIAQDLRELGYRSTSEQTIVRDRWGLFARLAMESVRGKIQL